MADSVDSASYGGVPAEAPPLAGPTMFAQEWLDLAFLHWPVDPDAVARFFPPGVRPDVWRDGATYVGLVPFRMHNAGWGSRWPIPFFGSFYEWNVRLYSVDAAGRHGVLFRSLDASRLAVVALARLAFRIPYRYAHIESRRFDDRVEWRLRRRGLSRPRSDLRLRVGERTQPTPLEVFLTSRWGMHAPFGRTAMWVQNHHGPWPLHTAELLELNDELVAAAGIEPVGPMLRPLWSPGVHARFSPPRAVAAEGSRTRAPSRSRLLPRGAAFPEPG